jgi:hypothetical protein
MGILRHRPHASNVAVAYPCHKYDNTVKKAQDRERGKDQRGTENEGNA